MRTAGMKREATDATQTVRQATLVGGLSALGRWWWTHWQEYGRAGGGMMLSRVRQPERENGVPDAAE